MALESLPKIAPALFSAEQDLIQIYNKKSDTVGTINASYIGGSTPPSGVSGAIQFSNGSAFASDAANLFWDDTNNRLGVGTNAPTTALDIQGADNAFLARFGTGSGDVKIKPFLNATYGTYIESRYGDGTLMPLSIGASRLFAFTPVSIGTDSTSAMLQVKGSGSTAATTALLVQNSLGNNALTIKDDLSATFSNTVYGGGFVFAAVSELYLNCRVTTTNPVNPQYRLFSSEGNASQTIAPTTSFHDIRDFTPTSGSALYTSFEYSGTINQTGGANGITRGLYINPTLTAAANFRAIETTQGNVLLATTSGRVGIGTNAPTQALEIGGNNNIKLNNDGSLYLNSVRYATNNGSIYVGDINATNTEIYLIPQGGGVNGSIRLGGGQVALIKGSGTTSGTTSLLVQNSGGSNALQVTDDQVVRGYDGTSLRFRLGGNAQSGISTRAGALCVGYIDANFESGLQLSAEGTGKTFIDGWNDGGSAQYDIVVGRQGSRTQFGTDSASVSSAQVAINSTTRGFLPPRMTDAQIRIIASPAVGLMAYNTDLDCPVFYSAAGWRKVSHSVM